MKLVFEWHFFLVLVAVITLGIFWRAIKAGRAGAFYADTFWLLPWGIFVWGDALILAPFWLVVVGVSWWQSPVVFLRFYLLFLTFRFGYEVIYWLNHQAHNKEYHPPLFRHISWLKPHDAAILYQLLTMCGAVLSLWMFLGFGS